MVIGRWRYNSHGKGKHNYFEDEQEEEERFIFNQHIFHTNQ